MAVILNAIGTTYPASIPKLPRDKIANNGTLDIFDALDTYSWPSQAAPASNTWGSVIGANTASFAGAVGWTNGFTVAATSDIITFPSTFKPGASAQRAVIFWVKVGTQAFTTGQGPIAWTGDTSASSQFLWYITHGATEAAAQIAINSGNGAAQIFTAGVASLLPANRVLQLAVSMQPESGVYRYKVWVNNVLKASFLSALATLPQPTANFRTGGTISGFGNAFTGTHLRALCDDLSVVTPEALVAADYAAYSARFS